MNIFIDEAGARHSVEADAGCTVLDVLQAARVEIRATCGGVGKCGRCQVLVRDGDGMRHCLACTTPASDGMEVVVERVGALEVVQGGMAAAFPPDEGAAGFGMAVDIGTTTIVAHLHDLSTGERLASVGRANPQIAFGSDVISRITASVDGKLALMRDVVQDAMREMKAGLCESAGVLQADVERVTMAGNTVMQHIAVGLAPDSIGVSPFEPLSLFGDEHDIPGLGACRLTRCIAGYVGGDIVAGMLACGLDAAETRLFMDLGTNGEMALATGGRIACCATAAGPVFEGANVRFGMPASPGAISAVRQAGEGLELEVVGNVAPIGVCGTGLIDAVALMVSAGVVDETGRLLAPDEAEGPLSNLVGRVEDRAVFFLTQDRSVFITQDDVRNLQLAKAAVRAGIQTMADAAGVSMDEVVSLEVAGGFGMHLNLESAAIVGLIPPELKTRATCVGNTSGEGASALLVSSAARAREAEIVGKCDYVELSTSPAFNMHFVELMEFDA